MKQYESLRKKYKLPSWKWVQKNFYFIPDETPLIMQIEKRITEKLQELIDMLEPLIIVNENYINFIERKILTKKKREKLFEVYKKLKFLVFEHNKLSISYNEKEQIEWIKTVESIWEYIRTEMEDAFDILSKGWKNYKKKEVKTDYYG